MTVAVKLTPQPIPKSLMRVGCAGDFVKNLAFGTLSDQTIRNIQQGVSEGLIARILATGIDANGIPRERFWLQFDPLNDDVTIMLDLQGGKSTLEAVDVGLAGAIAMAVQIFKRKCLRPDIRFDYSASALANPAYLDEAKHRLGFIYSAPLPPLQRDEVSTPTVPSHPFMPVTPSPTHDFSQPLPLPPNYHFKTNLTITPAKDNGMHFGWDKLRRR